MHHVALQGLSEGLGLQSMGGGGGGLLAPVDINYF